ncbi:hypothetical protein N7539_008100 [Penicillium diatomitis]|uniref:Uncharacterized protein n=1 Tax=Penicillium diatomitis TaxID=2819901 RepID=A0A9X0BMZ1_9EURO|nr:uncharacterized protein N7539_008100 [Penicillium diatomitis]KAJ5475034.1 hypothetical protein N7539_008100 [Penicillium diatomitis]
MSSVPVTPTKRLTLWESPERPPKRPTPDWAAVSRFRLRPAAMGTTVKPESDFVQAARDKARREATTLQHHANINVVANQAGLDTMQVLYEMRESQKRIEAKNTHLEEELKRFEDDKIAMNKRFEAKNKHLEEELKRFEAKNKHLEEGLKRFEDERLAINNRLDSNVSRIESSETETKKQLKAVKAENAELKASVAPLQRSHFDARQRILATFVREIMLPPRGPERQQFLRTTTDDDLKRCCETIGPLIHQVHGGDVLLDADMICQRFHSEQYEYRAFEEIYGMAPGRAKNLSKFGFHLRDASFLS